MKSYNYFFFFFRTFIVNVNEGESDSNQTSEIFYSSNISVNVYDNSTLNFGSSTMFNCENNISSNLWTLKLKPPTLSDALSFINKLNNICHRKQVQLEHNNVIENIRKDLLSLTLPVSNDFNFFASESNIILEPLKQPPSYSMAFKWLESRNSKKKRKRKSLFWSNHKGIMTPESISKTLLVKKINHSTPNANSSKLHSISPYVSMKKENKYFKSRKKLSTILLDSLNVRQCTILYIKIIFINTICLYFRQIQVMILELNFLIHLKLATVQIAIF